MRCSPRRRAPNHTAKHQRFSDSSLLSECNTRDTESHSSEDAPKPPRMLPTSMLSSWPNVSTKSVRRGASSERDVLHPCESRSLTGEGCWKRRLNAEPRIDMMAEDAVMLVDTSITRKLLPTSICHNTHMHRLIAPAPIRCPTNTG